MHLVHTPLAVLQQQRIFCAGFAAFIFHVSVIQAMWEEGRMSMVINLSFRNKSYFQSIYFTE